jgi:papilin
LTKKKVFITSAQIVKAEYCTNKYYAKFCCMSCTLAGQLRGY